MIPGLDSLTTGDIPFSFGDVGDSESQSFADANNTLGSMSFGHDVDEVVLLLAGVFLIIFMWKKL